MKWSYIGDCLNHLTTCYKVWLCPYHTPCYEVASRQSLVPRSTARDMNVSLSICSLSASTPLFTKKRSTSRSLQHGKRSYIHWVELESNEKLLHFDGVCVELTYRSSCFSNAVHLQLPKYLFFGVVEAIALMCLDVCVYCRSLKLSFSGRCFLLRR